jgi:hypothetical protein
MSTNGYQTTSIESSTIWILRTRHQIFEPLSSKSSYERTTTSTHTASSNGYQLDHTETKPNSINRRVNKLPYPIQHVSYIMYQTRRNYNKYDQTIPQKTRRSNVLTSTKQNYDRHRSPPCSCPPSLHSFFYTETHYKESLLSVYQSIW